MLANCIRMPGAKADPELEALQRAVEDAKAHAGREMVSAEETQEMIHIVETFLRTKELVCYGGTAINNVLPTADRFYDKETELPDYDFFSPSAEKDAIELADIYNRAGYSDVEAKAGVHVGTYKVYVNYTPVADVTHLPPELYKVVWKDSMIVDHIRYAPPNYLRMAMYLELSRPAGDVGRWEKVLTRLRLLNKRYPLEAGKCKADDFIREFEGSKGEEQTVYAVVRDSAIDQGLVFFGGYAASHYARWMSAKKKKAVKTVPDFDLLAERPERAARQMKERLESSGVGKVTVRRMPGIGEIVAPHYMISVGRDIVCFIYEPMACHSYNVVESEGRNIKVATIDTMLSFYLAFLYANRPYYDKNRILCMAEYLYTVQAKNRYAQKGVLKRFGMECYGVQKTLTDARREKAAMRAQLKGDRGGPEWRKWFLHYDPAAPTRKRKRGRRKTAKRRRRRTAKRRRRRAHRRTSRRRA